MSTPVKTAVILGWRLADLFELKRGNRLELLDVEVPTKDLLEWLLLKVKTKVYSTGAGARPPGAPLKHILAHHAIGARVCDDVAAGSIGTFDPRDVCGAWLGQVDETAESPRILCEVVRLRLNLLAELGISLGGPETIPDPRLLIVNSLGDTE